MGSRYDKLIVKLKADKYMLPAEIEVIDKYIYLKFPFNRSLLNEVKASFDNAHWCGYDDPPSKRWRVPVTRRNLFVLKYLKGDKPYAKFEVPLNDYKSKRPLWKHQELMVRQILTRKQCILAAEMGTGKTLAMITAMEELYNNNDDDFWYIGPKSGVVAVELELEKWSCKIHPRMMTYQGLVKLISESEIPTPKFICFDESAKIKTPTSQRSKAAMFVTDYVRDVDGYVVLLSGAPAPKSPVDWWHQAEVACPGFLREADIFKFRDRLAVTEERENQLGGNYRQLITWLDDEDKCAICGQWREDTVHVPPDKISLSDLCIEKPDKTASAIAPTAAEYHAFQPSINEVSRLYKRLQGLTVVINKKDCLDLPEKIYRIIKIRPDPDTVRAAKSIANVESAAITASIKLRELSDGFQYFDEPDGTTCCDVCHGSGEEHIPETRVCTQCGGTGEVTKYKRGTKYIKSKKEDVFLDLLEDHEEIGRFITWAAFTGTIEHLISLSLNAGWYVLRIDSKFLGLSPKGEQVDYHELLKAMDRGHKRYREYLQRYPKIIAIGHPKAGGNALTLTASPTELYYSNDFDGDARIQSEDRFHRPSMDENKGATIIDLIHLPTDLLVLNNLKQKKNLQDLTMDNIRQYLESEIDYERS